MAKTKKAPLKTVPIGVTCGGYAHIAKLFIEASIRLTKEGEHQKAEEQRDQAFKLLDIMAEKWATAIYPDVIVEEEK